MVRGTRARRAFTFILLGGAAPMALSLGTVAPAAAQESEPQEAEVRELVVTGSRIRGVEAVGSNVVAVGQEEIQETGVATTGELMRKFPQVVGLGPSATGSSAQNGAANVTRSVGLNLRGLGVNATLPLWDGRRFPAAGTQGQLVDVSVIPAMALERIEVVPDGASAIYGSDAVTGVVNMILRKHFDGVETRARYGWADGFHEWQAGVLAGKTWAGGSAMLTYEHYENSALSGRDRDWYSWDQRSRGGRDYRNSSCFPPTIVSGGSTYAVPAGGVTSPAQLVRGTSNLCDTIKDNWIIPEQERDSVVGYVRQELGERFEVFAQGYYSKRDLLIRGNGGTPGSVLTNQAVPSANPFFVSPTPGATSVNVNYSFIPVWGFDHNPGFSESYDLVAGVSAELWGDWEGELAAYYGRSDDKIRRTQQINAAAVTAALADRNPATALNLFGGPNNPATLAAIRNGLFIIGARTGLKGAELRADGTLFEAPGGLVRMAVGAEYRDELLVTNLTSGSALAPRSTYSRVNRDMRAVYAEIFVPLVGEGNAMPLVQRLEFSLAGRFEDYSDFGETSNPKVGLTWVPVDGLKIRASYGTSFRAPSPAEYDTIGGGAGLYGDNLPDPASPTGQSFGIGIAGGNAGLAPEEATTWSVGFDWRPDFAPALQLSGSYFDLEYESQILALRGTPGLLSNPLYSRFVIRNPTRAQVDALLASGLPLNTPINPAAVTFIADGRRQNLGLTIAKGVDFLISGDWETDVGRIDASFGGSYFTELRTALAPGAPITDVASTINNPQRLRFRADLGWTAGPVRAVAMLNFVDSYRNTTVNPAQKVDDYATVDLHFSYDLGQAVGSPWAQDLTLALDVQNAFDQHPPFVDANTGGYDPQSASPIGRLVAVSLMKRF